MRTTLALALSFALLASLAPTAQAQEAPLLVIIQDPSVAAPAAAYDGDPVVGAPAVAYAGGPAVDAPGPQELVPPRSRGGRRDWALIGAGAGMALGGWALNVVGSLLWVLWPGSWGNDNTPYLSWATVPVAGPIMQLTTSSSEEWQAPIAVIISGVQLAGWIMAIVGTASPSDEVAPLAVLPVVSDGYAGVAAGGRF